MPEPKIGNRWWVVIGAILVQLCLGAIYAWSVFTKKITIPLSEGGTYGFSASQAAWIFSTGLAAFAVTMVLAGSWAKKKPRKATITGGAVLGLGYLLGGLLGKTFALQLVCIGLVGGAGIGIAYVVPIAVGLKWFPDKKGMIAGLGVAGFGFGATIWVKLAGSWFGGLLNTTSILGLPGVQSAFVIYGFLFFLIVLAGSRVMVDPPEGYVPAGWIPPEPGTKGGAATKEYTPREMLKSSRYYALLLMFVGSGLAGLMVIYCIRLFGIDALQASGHAPDATSAGVIAGSAMAWYAIFNGLGRIAWGTLSDRVGRKTALFAMCLLQGIIMLVFLPLGASATGLIIGAGIIGFNFGGNFALFPAATADYFGTRNLGQNYGWVFLAYAVAGIAGPQVAGFFKDAARVSGAGAEAWSTPFLIAGIACLAAAGIALTLPQPKKEKGNSKK